MIMCGLFTKTKEKSVTHILSFWMQKETFSIVDRWETMLFWKDVSRNTLTMFCGIYRMTRILTEAIAMILTSNSYDFDKLITDVLIKNSALFSYRIEQRKQNEKRKEEEAQRIAERQAEEKKQIDRIKDYCSRKGLFFYQDYTEGYLLKALTETATNMLTTADKKQMDYIIDFAQKHPDNKDVAIVKHDTMENILKYIA